MELNILIETSESCYFNVKDITCGDLGYLPESSQVSEIGRFKYKDTIALARVTLNKTSESIIESTIFIPHILVPDYVTIPTQFDGWFTLDYIVIPTKEWFDKSEGEWLHYDTIYYSDGTNIYKYFQGESSQVSADELFERNIEDTTISKITQNFMSICYLKKCFISLCKEILDKRGFAKCKVKGGVDDTIIYNRDLIWMTLNTISYLTEFGQLAEAQRILELIEEGCNGICKSRNREYTSYGCGCS